jgi:acetylornithine deacetylase/succinyl-diaminopimelate desuccinylase-like protein
LADPKKADMELKTVDGYIASNKDRFIDELIGLLRIPSVSADPTYAKDVHQAASLLADHLKNMGIDKVEICPTKGFPDRVWRKDGGCRTAHCARVWPL